MNTQKSKNLFYLIALMVALLFYSTDIYSQANWFKTGSDPGKYIMGADSSVQHNQQNAFTISSIDKEIPGFGSYMQTSTADKYLGKRIRMTGYMKSKDVTAWAGFWLRVDQAGSQQFLSFDNMQDRPIKGSTDWNKYAIVLDVPNNASSIAFGALLGGTGQIWFDNPQFEVVDNSVQTTGLYSKKDSEFVALTPQSCETESTRKSLNSDQSTFLRFKNNTSGSVTVYWINYSGQRDTSVGQIRHIASGEFVDTQTFLTHPFIVIGSDGKCYGIYEATANASIAIIKD